MPKLSRNKKNLRNKIAKATMVVGLTAATIAGTSVKTIRNEKPFFKATEFVEREPKVKSIKFFPKNATSSLRNPAQGFPFQKIIDRKSKKYNLPREIAVRIPNVIIQESWVDQDIVGSSGDCGLMGISPQLLEDAKRNGLKITDIFDPAQNIEVGCWQLSRIYKNLKVDGSRQKFLSLSITEQLDLVFWAYRKGLGHVQKNSLNGMSTKGRSYLSNVTAQTPFRRFEDYKAANPNWHNNLINRKPQFEHPKVKRNPTMRIKK